MKKLFLKMKTINFKKTLLFLTVYLSCIGLSFGQAIFSNPISHSTPYNFNPYTIGQSVNANITVSGIGRGSGISGNAGSNRYNARSWAGSFDSNDYFYFTITPNPGYEIDFMSFSYSGQRSGTGPSNHAFRSSIDSYASNIGSPTSGGTTISLAAPEYQNVQGAITFRFYAWGAGSGSGTFSINDFVFNGTVTAIPVDTCNLSDTAIADITCNNNGTDCNTGDDYITFSLNPVGTELGTNYDVSVSNGTISPTTAAYGAPTTFTLQNGSAGGGDVTLTITDGDDTACELIENITDPGSCAATSVCLDDNFNSGYGSWSGGSGTYQNSTAGVTGNGVGFNSTGDNIITGTTVTDPQEIAFWLAISSSSANRTLSIQYSESNTGPWTTARNITQNQVTTTHQLFTTELNLSGEYYLRIAMTQRSGGSFYLDDVAVSCAMSTPQPVADAEQSFCGDGTTVADLEAEGENLKWYNVASGGTPLESTSILISESSYYVSQTIDGCESERVEVAVTITSTAAPIVETPQEFCGEATVADLMSPSSANLPSSEEGFEGYTTENALLLSVGNHTFSSGNWNVTGTAYAQKAGMPLVDGGDDSYCVLLANGASFTSPSFEGLNTVSFYAYMATGSEPIQIIKVINGVETLLEEVTLGSGGSSAAYQQYIVNVNDDNEDIQIRFTMPSSGIIRVDNVTFSSNSGDVYWYNTETGGTPLADTDTLSTGNYYVSQNIEGCESNRAEVAVVINDIPEAPEAEDQTFCGEATISDLVAVGDDIQWYDVATNGIPLADTEELIAGNYYATQTIEGCESDRIEITVILNPIPNKPIAQNQMFCGSVTVADLEAEGENIQWYDVSVGGTPLESTMLLSTTNYYVSQTINDCESERTEVSVTVNEIPDAPIAENQAFCGEATVANLLPQTTNSFSTIFEETFNNLSNWNAVNVIGNQVWVTDSHGSVPNSPYAYMNGYDGGNFANEDWLVSMPITIPSTAIDATFSFISASNFSGANIEVFYATEYSGGDPNVDGNWTVLNPTLSTGGWNWANSGDLDVSAAIGDNLYIAFKYTSTTSSGKAWEIDSVEVVVEYASPAWYDVDTGGTPLTTDVSLSTGTYYVGHIENGCESERTEVEVTVNEIPDAPLANNQDFCGEATVVDLVADGENIQWYDMALGGMPLESTTVLTTTSYYASQTVNDCESERVEVVVTVKPIPDAPLAEDQAFCGDATVADLVADGENIQWYDVETEGTPLADTDALTTGIYYASQTIDNCESERTEIEVTAEDLIEPTAQCVADITIQLNSDGQANIDVEMIDEGSFDNCGINTITLSQTEFDCSHIGENEIILTVTDNNGNFTTCMTIVTVEEIIAPIANCEDVVLELDSNGEAILTPDMLGGASTDNCGIEITATDIENFNCSDIGTPVNVTYFAMDSSGNISSCTALVTVEDTIAPEIECPSEPIVVEINPDITPYIVPNFYEGNIINITDNCDTGIIVTQNPIPGALLGEGTYEIDLTAIDASGNETTCSFEVVVDDGLNNAEFNVQAFTLYPNPTSGKITISNPNDTEISSVSVYDILGKRVQKLNINAQTDITVDLSELPSAVYMMQIKTSSGHYVYKRVVKE